MSLESCNKTVSLSFTRRSAEFLTTVCLGSIVEPFSLALADLLL